MPEVTVAVCACNEKETLPKVVEALCRLSLDQEVLIVDDGSNDQTGAVAQRFCSLYPNVRLLRHGRQRGKGAALRTALKVAKGKYFAIQDADLEYEVSDIPKFLNEMKARSLDVLFGSRFLTANPTHYPLYYLGNQWVSRWISFLGGTVITDAYTGRKLFVTEVLRGFSLTASGFEIEAEMAIKTTLWAVKKGIRFFEIPIHYHPRTKSEGKKIRILDGFWAFIEPLRYLYLRTGIN